MLRIVKKFLGVEVFRKADFLYPFFQLDSKVLRQIQYFQRRFDQISGLEGAIVECGIGYSRSFQNLCLLTELENKKRTVWGFDSFEGFPEPTIEDQSPRNPKKGEWKVITVAQLYRILELIRLNKEFINSQIRVRPGFFEATLPKAEISKIALLHLDVDLYGSYKTCLEQLFPKVVAGGVVLFDEYDDATLNWPGAKKAIDEYLAGKGYEVLKDQAYDKYFLIKK